jgi:hypothetical protein
MDVIASTICFSREVDVLIGGNDDHTLKFMETPIQIKSQYLTYHLSNTKRNP